MCGGGSKGNVNERKQNQEIERNIVADKKEQSSHIKLLLLGAGESGKSTIAKQMKIIHLNGFTDEERLSFKSIIFSNLIGSAKVLCEASKTLKNDINPETEPIARRVLEEDYFTGELTPDLAKDLKALWADPGIQKTFSMSNQFQLNDSAEYYFEAVDRLASPNYIPDVQDVLRSRAKTTGIIETDFVVGKTKFTLVDVGGQRSERRKWMHCFENVTAVIFCVALSAYDLKLYEDDDTNRMVEAMRVFSSIITNEWFKETAIILFFNKKDLFEKKIKQVPLTYCFPEYTGANNFEEAGEYIVQKFLQLNENPRKLIYHHYTCATDTENINTVIKAVQDILLHGMLEKMGM